MKTKIKSVLKIILPCILLFLSVSLVEAAENNCYCSKGSLVPFSYPRDAVYTTGFFDAEGCRTMCMQVSDAKYFSHSNIANIFWQKIYNCLCVDGSIVPFYYPLNSSYNVNNDDACNQQCADKGTKYYSYSNVANLGATKVTKTPITAQSATTTTTSTGKYVPMEKIPGFEDPADFPTYLMNIYKFGLGAIGVSAMFMIMIGGYMYLTSAGNTAQTGKAKGVIFDAIAGLALALVSYVLLWTINPDLVKFKSITGQVDGTTGTTSKTGAGSGSTGGTIAENYAKACPTGDAVVANKSIITDFSKAPNDPKIAVDSNCAKLISSSVDGVSAKILQTIAQIESSCGANKGESPAKCCGLMQLDPATASTLNGSPVTCAQLIADDALSIRLAAKYIKQSGYLNDSEKVFAGYNSGYGKNLTSDGKKPALADSSDCPGKSAFECCENPGELKETISYVWNATGLMSK